MNESSCAEAAGALLEAYRTGQPVKPLVAEYPDITMDDAYAIQQVQLQSWLDSGLVLKGHKVGLTSAAMQQQMGVDQPDFGVLLENMFYPEFSPIPVEAFIQPRIEPEIGLVLGRDLTGPGVTIAEAAAAVDFVLPALEIIDSRIEDWKISITDTIADNASSGGVVLGSSPTPLTGSNLALVGCNLYGNGALVASGAGGAVLGSPLLAVAWLANTVGQHGVTLRAGHVVLTGSVTRAQVVVPGDTWSAQFAGLGSVTARFALAPTSSEKNS